MHFLDREWRCALHYEKLGKWNATTTTNEQEIVATLAIDTPFRMLED